MSSEALSEDSTSDILAILLALAWLVPSAYYWLAGQDEAVKLPPRPAGHPPVPFGADSPCEAALRVGSGQSSATTLSMMLAAVAVAWTLWRRSRQQLPDRTPRVFSNPFAPVRITHTSAQSVRAGQHVRVLRDGKHVDMVVPGPPLC